MNRAITEPVTPAAPGTSMTRATARLLVFGLLLLALMPPLATVLALTIDERHDAADIAESLASSLAREPLPLQPAALRALLAQGVPEHDGQRREALAADGSVLAAVGDLAAGLPHVTVQRAAAHGPVVAMRVSSSLTGAPVATAAVAAVSCTMAVLIWILFVRSSVGDLRRAEGRLRSITLIDPLTGLLNRAGLRQRMQRALAGEGAGARRAGLLLIDLDRFRLINDSFGQRAGDQLLRAVAERIRSVLRQGDAAARLGGDQFVVFSRALSGDQSATVMARNLLRAIEPALALGEHEASVSVSIGIALADGPTPDPDPLLAQADAAMRAAKAGGGSRARMFDPSMLVNTGKQLELDMALRRALQNGEFDLAYQPIVAQDGETVQAVEALLRWNDPARGPVPPAEFIPVLEQTGLIVPVGLWVLREACRRVQGWIGQGAAPVVLSVNVSPMQFAEADFVSQVLSALRATGLPPAQLQLEVTEGLLLDPTPEALRKIDALTDAGVRLAVDDFGMGYSSLVYLKRFRLHSLKIDREFLQDVPRAPRATAIVRAIVDLGHALGLHVTAEGVETAEQRDALCLLGCDSMQGFLFARPMSAEAMRERIVVDEVLLRSGESVPADWSTTMAASLDIAERP